VLAVIYLMAHGCTLLGLNINIVDLLSDSG